jgi:hypothetical protein
MVLNAAWPLLAGEKPAVSASPSEICSASGAKHAPAAPDKGLHASHCTLCPFGWGAAIAHAALLLLPSAAPVAPATSRADAPPAGIAFHPAAPPRAPPLSA